MTMNVTGHACMFYQAGPTCGPSSREINHTSVYNSHVRPPVFELVYTVPAGLYAWPQGQPRRPFPYPNRTVLHLPLLVIVFIFLLGPCPCVATRVKNSIKHRYYNTCVLQRYINCSTKY
jgi:hypothetical protein